MQMPVIRRRPPSLPDRRSWPVVAGLMIAVVTFISLTAPGLRDPVGGIPALVGQFDSDALHEALRPLGLWTPVVYLLVQAAQVLVPFLPGAPVTFAGVLLFGWKAGLLLSMAGFMIGSALQFAAVRRWGGPLVVRMAGEEVVRRSAGRLDPRGWWLLAAFLVPFAPADAFSALAALSPISFRRFLLVSFLGRLPWAAGTVLLAAGLIGGSAVSWAAAGLALAAVVAVGIAYRLRSRRAVDPPATTASRSPCPWSLCRLRCPHRPFA
jgi:uncharacterized membrane protein YdjX (TVP38/TMEM64 family)